MDQYDTMSAALVAAVYGRGPKAMAREVAKVVRKFVTDMQAAGVEAAMIAAAIERVECADIARGWRNGNPDAVARCDWTGQQIATAIEARGASRTVTN